MNQAERAIAYSMNFISFLFLEKSIKDRIISIYLFGSSVREELDKESDIDIFINCKKEDEELITKASRSAESNFRKSKDFDKWEKLEFTYPISIKSGPIDEWELKTSIKSEGIQLYSRSVISESLEKLVIFSLDFPKKKKDYLKISRILFGRKDKNYLSKGLVENINGKRLGSNAFIIPKSEQTKLIDILYKNKINFKMDEVSKQR